MDKTVPAGAAILLDFLRDTETARDNDATHDADAYTTIIGHKESQLAKPITSMTIDELSAEQLRWVREWRMPSGAAGAYQIIRKTLLGLKKQLGLAGSEKFTPALQDRMGLELLRLRGLDKFLAGRMTETAFALELAKEWASMPVLAPAKGATRKLKVGQSYYAGDGVNKALVTVSELKAVLASARTAGGGGDAQEEGEIDFPEKGDMDNEVVAQVQRRLKELGYTEVGNVDGDFLDMTEKAILIFRHDNGLELTPTIDEALLVAMAKAAPRKLPEGRTEATPADVREKVPEARDSWWSKVLALFGMVGTGIAGLFSFLIDNVGGVKASLKPLTDTIGSVPMWGWAVLLGGGLLAIWLKSRAGEKKTVEAYQEGARR